MWDTAAQKRKNFQNKEELKNFLEMRKSVDHKKLQQLSLTIDFGKELKDKPKDFGSFWNNPEDKSKDFGGRK